MGTAELARLADAARRDFIWLPGNPGRYGRAAAATNSDRLASVQGEFQGVVAEMEREAARALKLDHKVPLPAGDRPRRLVHSEGSAEQARAMVVQVVVVVVVVLLFCCCCCASLAPAERQLCRRPNCAPVPAECGRRTRRVPPALCGSCCSPNLPRIARRMCTVNGIGGHGEWERGARRVCRWCW